MLIHISSAKQSVQIPLDSNKFHRAFKLIAKELKNEKEYLNFELKLGKPKSFDLHFCDDVEMRKLQKRFRKLNRTTDVLSFPSLESPSNNLRGYLGSIVISLPQVRKNAKRYRKTFNDELLNVYVHGVLHLFGFDHVRVSALKKKRMFSFQSKILSLCLKGKYLIK